MFDDKRRSIFERGRAKTINENEKTKGFFYKNIPFCGGSNRKQRSKRIIGSTFPCFY